MYGVAISADGIAGSGYGAAAGTVHSPAWLQSTYAGAWYGTAGIGGGGSFAGVTAGG